MGVSSRYCIHWTEYQRAARRVIRSLKKAIAPRVTAGRWVGRDDPNCGDSVWVLTRSGCAWPSAVVLERSGVRDPGRRWSVLSWRRTDGRCSTVVARS